MTKKVWMHVVINARCSWLHGDPRGFRDREHRIHSSGDYKNRPPKGEHAGLLAYHQARSNEPISFDQNLRIFIAREFLLKLIALGHRVIACSVSEEHLHVLVELPNVYETMKREIGKAKQKASHSVRDLIPGSIWATGGEFKRITDIGHFHNSYNYIRMRQEFGTVVWSHNPEEDWIQFPKLDVIIMAAKGEHTRAFPTDASV